MSPSENTIAPAVGERELIVIADPAAGLRAMPGELLARTVDAEPITSSLAGANARMVPLFGATEDRVRHRTVSAAARAGTTAPDLSVYYRVHAPDEALDGLAAELAGHDGIVAAYVKPPAEPAVLLELNEMTPLPDVAPPVTADFTSRQGYLDAAPGGIDARYAWTRPGGRGAGVSIIDIEGAWRFDHEDLIANAGGAVGTQSTDIAWRNHGTAVQGEFGGDDDAFGVMGISPDANARGFSIFGGTGSAAAIHNAADALSPGDIILIELHRPGPGASGSGQDGYIAIEWWPDDWDAIHYATATRGVVVVEAAVNGARNLDDPIYNTPDAGFPAGWTNPFNRSNRDSGAIIVGAGAPPPGTHGSNWGDDRSRLDFSNYGSSVDAQGWGREVTTCGYGDLQGGTDERAWYTDRFSGTSSASPIVVGAVACTQGNRRARGLAPYTPAQMRAQLRSTGSAQQDTAGRPATQRIGNRPDLRQLLDTKVILKELKREKLELKELKREKIEIKEKPEKREKIEKFENKEIKREKVENKELKDEKEFLKREKPEKLEFEKDVREVKPKENEGGEVWREPDWQQGADVTGRLNALETAVSQLSHFIGEQLRPDLGQGALSDEPDYPGKEPEKLGESY